MYFLSDFSTRRNRHDDKLASGAGEKNFSKISILLCLLNYIRQVGHIRFRVYLSDAIGDLVALFILIVVICTNSNNTENHYRQYEWMINLKYFFHDATKSSTHIPNVF